ncbi:hypothetical protein AURDEDRAFT_129758 [Auricularia subglabra TFB-10046 SS5]|uniref:Extracellular membrane protein CFEM domain-containing protein n=1 Tax=Auricularia subglabra (strain TFB-10046 / SS5) TaxID=717982 RepID=J0DAA4_AURST|nr:hypothetical protein AURDEDRAFT_129758 [Auricularia subglabra TFB-10046 SS5]
MRFVSFIAALCATGAIASSPILLAQRSESTDLDKIIACSNACDKFLSDSFSKVYPQCKALSDDDEQTKCLCTNNELLEALIQCDKSCDGNIREEAQQACAPYNNGAANTALQAKGSGVGIAIALAGISALAVL